MEYYLLLVGLVVAVVASEQDVSVRNGNAAELKCNSTSVWTSRAQISSIMWISPSGAIYNKNVSNMDIVLLPEANVLNMLLHIGSVRDEHWGSYACLVTLTSGSNMAVVIGLNIDGEPQRDLWALYRDNVILGASVGGGFFVLSSLLCLVYHCSYHKRVARRVKKLGLDEKPVELANQGFDETEQM